MHTTAIGVNLVFIFLSSAIAFPLAGPPLPLDPAISAVAPPQCLWYGSSAGVAEADPSSPNQTEQLFAEPEVKYFIDELQNQLIGVLRRAAGPRREERILTTEIPKLLRALMSRPVAGFVEDFQITDDGISVQAGVVLNAGSGRAELEAAIDQLMELAMEKGAPIGTINRDGESLSMFRASMQTPEIRWGWHQNYFILGVGSDSVEAMLDRLGGSPPAWLEELRRDYSLERESSLCYFDVEILLDRLKPLLEKEGGWSVVEKLGLTSIKSFHSLSGFDTQGCVTKSRLETDGRRDGLLALLPEKQLSDNDLKLIPHDALIATAIRLDLADTWDNLLRLIEDMQPVAAENIEKAVWQMETKLRVNLEDDVLGSLDDVWTAYVPSGDLMTSWVGSAVACKVKDAPRLQSAMKTLIGDLRAKLPQGNRGGVRIQESEFEGQTIYVVKVVGEPFPFTPAWCVTDDWLLLGFTPQTIRGLITRDQIESLAEVEEVRQVFGSRQAPTALTYCDSPKLARSLYPLAQMGLQMLSAQLQRQGIEFDTTILPSQDSIIRHLRPSVSVMTSNNGQVAFLSQHSLPGGGNSAVMAPMVVGTLMPALFAARTASRRTQDLNNMRQLALAFHNYESTHGKFPANSYDDDGKPLLSWRVHLLPYLEQQALYQQFRLDEPWDSPHNKPLSERVLPIFVSPSDVPSNKTRYVALASEDSIFPGNVELSFRHVTDGTSNTIMLVQSTPQASVPWAQPKDLDFDAEKPFAGLRNDNGFFPVAMTDGSCQTLSFSIGEDTMRAYATRAGSEVIER